MHNAMACWWAVQDGVLSGIHIEQLTALQQLSLQTALMLAQASRDPRGMLPYSNCMLWLCLSATDCMMRKYRLQNGGIVSCQCPMLTGHRTAWAWHVNWLWSQLFPGTLSDWQPVWIST